jgi:AcrR family transcriptional regulator
MKCDKLAGMKAILECVAKGRPREFDTDKALDRALQVFWRKGYEGASLSDLTSAMGINRPSLYAAFGDKQALFRKVLDRYSEGPGAYVCEALQQPTARFVAEGLLRGAANLLSDRRHPPGCLAVQGALACGEEAKSVRKELVRRRGAIQDEIRQRFERAIKEGDLPDNADPAALAGYVVTVANGMAVQAASGAKPTELRRIAEMAMRAWPR